MILSVCTLLPTNFIMFWQSTSSYLFSFIDYAQNTSKTLQWHRNGCDLKSTASWVFFPTVYSGANQSKYQSSTSLAFVWGIYQWQVNSLHKCPVTQKMFLFDDIILKCIHHTEVTVMWKNPFYWFHWHAILSSSTGWDDVWQTEFLSNRSLQEDSFIFM